MSPHPFDLAVIGNAIVDILTPVEESFLSKHDLPKGRMILIDQQKAEEIYASLHEPTHVSGGSGANTAVGFSSFGGKAAFMGKTCDDALGRIFKSDILQAGVHYNTKPLESYPSTARCFVFITPDAERTMLVYLGACRELGPEDIDETIINNSGITYIEGYQWDNDHAKEAILKACHLAKKAGTQVALSLSDAFCVDRHRGDFLSLMENYVTILFANSSEITSLFETNTLEEAAKATQHKCALSAITLGASGSLIITPDQSVRVDASPVEEVIDTTGAGDLYATGFLYGYTHRMDLKKCGQLGALAAGEIISHIGARPKIKLSEFLKK